MTIDWALLLLVAAAGWMGHMAWQQLGGKLNWWVLPYRQRCRRYGLSWNGQDWCRNTIWMIRWSSLIPMSKVCRSCRQADQERMKGRLGT